MKEIAFVEMTSQMSGVEFSTLYLVQYLNRERWHPTVICPKEGDLPTRCREHRIPVSIVPRKHFISTSAHIGSRTIVNPFALIVNLGAVISSAHTLSQFLRKHRPHLVVTKGLVAQFYGGLAARWLRIPCVWHVQDRVSNRAGPLFVWTLSLAGRLFAREIIVDAESIARQLRPVVADARIHVIWNGVDTRTFSPDVDGSRVRAEWNAQVGDVLIGVVGRLVSWKGQHVLIHALAELASEFPAARIVLIGTPLFEDDVYARRLRAETAALGLDSRVIFTGFRWDMPQVLAALDIVVHTALDKDSTPLAVVSAMAAGKPIVCTRVDGMAQLFEDGVDGLLVTPGDANALAEALSLLLRNADLRGQLGRAAREKAERELSIEQFTRQCEAVFAQALSNSEKQLGF